MRFDFIWLPMAMFFELFYFLPLRLLNDYSIHFNEIELTMIGSTNFYVFMRYP